MPPRLFNIFFDRVVGQVNERAMGMVVKLRDENGWGWEIKKVLYADDTVLVAETREHLQHIASEYKRVCDSMGLKINVGKSKVLMVKKNQMLSCEKGRVSREEMQKVDKINYLGVMISRDGGMGDEVAHRVFERRKV